MTDGEIRSALGAYLIDTDRVANGVVYTSPKPGVPPVFTGAWDERDWEKWDHQTARVGRLQAAARGIRVRVVAI